MVRALLIIFSVFFTREAFGQTLGFSLSDKKKVEIPIEIHNNLVVVPVVLNGTLPLRFIVDTGVRTAILTEKAFADILHLTYNRKYIISGVGGEKLIEASVTNNVSLSLPGVSGKGQALLVLEKDYLELRNYLGADVHGILGYELFSRFIININYEAKTMTVIDPERFRPRRGSTALPITVEDTKPYIMVPVVLEGDKVLNVKLLIDTGASHGLLLDPGTDNQITLPSKTIKSILGRGLGGEVTGHTGKIKQLKFGPYVFKNIVANFPDPNSYMDSLKIGNIFRNGSIGGGILNHFSVTFDFPNGIMYLRKTSSLKKKNHYNLSGITVKAKGAHLDIFEITDVREGSPAYKAGIVPGEELIELNGIPAKSLDLEEVNNILNSKPNKKVKLYLEKDKIKSTKQIVLEDPL